MGTLAGPGVGARTQVEYVNEATWGTMVSGATLGTTGQAMGIVSESIKNNIGELVSATLTADRGVRDSIRGSNDVSGDINFEFAPDAGEYMQMIKQAMCLGTAPGNNYLLLESCIGHWGLQVYTSVVLGGVNLVLTGPLAVVANWDTPAGDCTVITRTAAGVLQQHDEAYVGLATAAGTTLHTLNIAAIAGNCYRGGWVFPKSVAKYNNTHVHYIEVGDHIGIGMDLDILRDISLFVYTGMKVGTMTMNFNAGEMVNGVFSVMGKEENIGGRLVADLANAAAPVNVDIDDIRIFNDGLAAAWPSAVGGTLMIGHEGAIPYASVTGAGYVAPAGRIVTTAVTGAVALGTDSLAAAAPGYFRYTPVSPQDSRANDGAGNRVDLQSTTRILAPPYSYFEAAGEQESGLSSSAAGGQSTMGTEAFEIVNFTFTLDNSLYTDKYVLGSRFRAMLPEQRRNVTGTLTYEFDNIKQYRKFFDGTKFAVLIRCVSQDVQYGYIDNTGGGSVDVPYSACFYFRNCVYSGETPNVGGPDLIITDFPFRALVYKGAISSVFAATDEMPYYEFTAWFTTSRSTTLWA